MSQDNVTIPTILSERYRIISVLGGGGFCDTFLAQDTQMPSGRRCVIKELKPLDKDTQIDQLIQKRFQREAATLEELGGNCNQIPTLYAYFQRGEKFYLVQEWIEGQTLTQTVQQNGCLSETEVISILISLLKVLDYIHSHGIIHRDIKPDNIILRLSNNQPVLIDFGAVRETMGAMVHTEGTMNSSIIVGTPGFMPNEQVAGRPIFSSDLYSLGLTAIYLLTGQLPQQMETDSYTGESVWLRDMVSPGLAAVLDKAIRFNPRERYPTAQAMLSALESLVKPFPGRKHTLSKVSPQAVPDTIQSAAVIQGQNGIFIGSIFIVGALVGITAIVGLLLSNFPQPQISTNKKKNASSSLLTKPQLSPTPFTVSPSLPVTSSSQAIQPPVQPIVTSSVLPNSFHFVASGNFPNLQTAVQQIKALQQAGYSETGMFWIPDYPNLTEKNLFIVYVATFRDRANCIEFLKNYGKSDSQAYCAFASKNPSVPSAKLNFTEIR
ncbi:MAG: serine/threonine-protein kinase [Scytonema sp. PMC 1069.18]|nr:serine/threonine-protein kinase [Scytonema sp. PMC 1069.18]MEC4884677.1 serine/threonine-protein kinase [Scytonema sp. PMC 1070.18]